MSDHDIDHASREHAPYSPSGAKRWMACPYAVQLSDMMPESPASEASARGTAIHEECEKLLRSWQEPADTPLAFELDGEMHGIPAVDWHEHAHGYLSLVRGVYDDLDLAGGEPDMELEKRVTTTAPTLCFGTGDTFITSLPLRELHVFDLKTGHMRVTAEGNAQGMLYAAGKLAEYPADTFDAVHIHIAQAHGGNTSWQTTPAEVLAHLAAAKKAITKSKSLDKRIAKAPSPEKKRELALKACVTGDHCEHCPRMKAQRCPAVHGMALSTVDMAETVGVDLTALSHEQSAAMYAKLPVLEAFIKAFKDHARDLAARGALPGYKLVEGRKTRNLVAPENDAEGMDEFEARIREAAKAKGHEDFTPWKRTAVSLTEIEKHCGKGVVDAWCDTRSGAPSVVRDTDKRPALDGSGADFSAFDVVDI